MAQNPGPLAKSQGPVGQGPVGPRVLGPRVQAQEGWKEDGVQRRGPGIWVDSVGEGITRPGERGAALDEFLGRCVGRWFDAGVGEELDAIGGRWQGDLGGLQMFANVAGAMILLLKESSEELVDFFG